jgi:mRNA interferase HicA
MKRTDFIRLPEKNGWWLERDKEPHTIYTDGQVSESVPRHKELRETLVKAIIKRRGLK